jgi:hypothetical protein
MNRLMYVVLIFIPPSDPMEEPIDIAVPAEPIDIAVPAEPVDIAVAAEPVAEPAIDPAIAAEPVAEPTIEPPARRRSGRPKKVVETPATPVTVERKRRKSSVGGEPSTKRKRKIKTPPPVVVSENPDIPPIETTTTEVPLSVEKRVRKIPKSARADVPPISGLPKYSNIRMGKVIKPEAPPPVVEDEAAVPPPPAEEEMTDAIVAEPPVEVVEKPVSPPQAKKPTAMELFLRTQPRVFSFAEKPIPSPEKAIEEVAEVSPSDTPRVPLWVIPSADFTLYREKWVQLRRSHCRPVERFFVAKDPSTGAVSPISSESIIPKKHSVYSGDGLVRRRMRRYRPVYIAIHDRERPPVKMIMTHQSTAISARRPLAPDTLIDYERDTDAEWVDEHEGEDLVTEPDEEEEKLEEESDADSFFVSDGHFSEGDAISEDELVLLRERRDQVVPVRKIDSLELVPLGPEDFAAARTGTIDISTPEGRLMTALLEEEKLVRFEPEMYFREISAVKKSTQSRVDWSDIRPKLAKFIHAKTGNIDSLSLEFKLMIDNPLISQNAVKSGIRTIANWTKKPELMPRVAWYVREELFQELGLQVDEMMELVQERKPPPKAAPTVTNVLPFKPTEEVSLEDRAIIHN